MSDAPRYPGSKFIGSVLIVGILYWAQAVIVPVFLALLMAFLLTPVVVFLERYVRRVAAVLAVVALVFATLGVMGWAMTQQLARLVEDLPTYRQNIHEKIRDIRLAGRGGSVETLQKTAEDIQADMAERPPPGTKTQPMVVRSEPTSTLWAFPTVLGPLLAPFATAGLVIALVVFMLLEREELRNRFIELFGHGRLVATTRAFDEAGRRVSRYLLAQSTLNLMFGTAVGIGLFFIGVPYPFLWAALAAALRFIPYLGPTIAAALPVFVALATLPGWSKPLAVVGVFVVLELITNLVLEPIVYAGAAGVSQVALLVAVAFWSWLWGPMGLLMATPLTVCLVVMGKYIPGLEFVAILLSDENTLAPHVSYYQRLLAGDHAEAMDLVERHSNTNGHDSVYDALMLPALNYVERDRIEERLRPDEEHAVIASTQELLNEVLRTRAIAPAQNGDEVRVLGLAGQGEADLVALRMLAERLHDTPIALDISPTVVLVSEILEEMKRGRYAAVCIADLPPSAPAKSRYLVKRLRASLPNTPLLVGRWAPAELADESSEALLAAGATHVATTLLETRDYLLTLSGGRA